MFGASQWELNPWLQDMSLVEYFSCQAVGDFYNNIMSVMITYCSQLSFNRQLTGADPGFFSAGGAPLRNDVTDWWHTQSLIQYTSCRSSGGGGGSVHPLHPSPRSNPASLRWSPRVGPCRSIFLLTDTSIRQTPRYDGHQELVPAFL